MREVKKLEPYRMLADALRRLQTRAPTRSWRLAVVGDGPARSEVTGAFSVLPPGRIAFLGSLEPEVLPTVYLGGRSLRLPRALPRRLSPGRRRGPPGRRVRGAGPRSHGRPGRRALDRAHARCLRRRHRPAARRSGPPDDDGCRGPALRRGRSDRRGAPAPPGRGARHPGSPVRSIYVALIRHAPTAWNAEGRVLGQADPPLSPEGAARAASWRLPARPSGAGGSGTARLGGEPAPTDRRDRPGARRDRPRDRPAPRRAGLGRVDRAAAGRRERRDAGGRAGRRPRPGGNLRRASSPACAGGSTSSPPPRAPTPGRS